MRKFGWLLSSVLLTSCVHYSDIHGNSQPLYPAQLTSRHIYKTHSSFVGTKNNVWWEKFNDPQLNQLIAIATTDSPTMQIAESRIRQAHYIAQESSAALLPSVDMNGYIQKQQFSEQGLIPPPFNGRTYNIGNLGLNFNYEFDFWGKNRNLLKARINAEHAAEAESDEARLILSSAIADTYFQLCNKIKQIEIANTILRSNEYILQIAIDRNQHGINSDILIKTLQANLQGTKQILERHQQAKILAQNQLAVLLGKNPFTTEIKTKAFAFHPVELPAYLPINILAQRPDVNATKLRAIAAASQIKVAEARFYPNINLNALLGYQAVGNLSNFFSAPNQNKGITAAIDLPIFDAGTRRANLGLRYAEYDQAVDEYNLALLRALREIADQESILKMDRLRLNAQNNAVNALQDSYNLYLLRYHHGLNDYAELLEKRIALLQQQSKQVDLQTQNLQDMVKMFKALGGKYA